MPRRSRYGTGRGSHMGKGPLSGSTVATIPSSVTMTRQGLQIAASTFLTPTELSCLDGGASKTLGYDRVGHFIETGIVDGLGRANVAIGDPSGTLSINFSNITTGLFFFAGVYSSTARSRVSYVTWEWSSTDTAGVSIYCHACTGGAAIAITGSSAAWLAVGK